jgi:predicted amidohydrolase
LGQLRVEGGRPEANLDRALRQISEARALGAAAIVLPEASDLGWTDDSSDRGAGTIPDGRFYEQLATAARRNQMFVVAGLTERAGSVVYNSAVLLGPEGDLLLLHRKIHELDIGRSSYACGDRLGVVNTRLGRIGLMICADAFAPGEVISRTLGLMGAEVILSPCAWAVPADYDPVRVPYGQLWRDCYGPVAKEHQLWIAGVSNVGRIISGPWEGRSCIGCSLVVGPDGTPRATGPYGEDAEALLLVEIAPVRR